MKPFHFYFLVGKAMPGHVRYLRVAAATSFFLLAPSYVLAQEIGADAQQQMAAIVSVKRNFTTGQQKMDSNLAFGILAAANDPSISTFRDSVAPIAGTDSNGNLLSPAAALQQLVSVEISCNVNADLLNAITLASGVVEQQSPQWGLITASLPLQSVEGIAARPDVLNVRRAATGQTNTGSLTSQGYISHQANLVVNTLGKDGTGVTVGVLSDSARPARIAALIASGDLPPGTHALPGQDGSSITDVVDEGTAMMELVHDMAPGANLIFATAFSGEASFANNILALAAAGSKVIVDDVTYTDEGVFQDGLIAQAVNQVTANGVIYFSSAANSGNLTNSTSGTWEGDFLNGGPVTGLLATGGETGSFHNFGSITAPQNFDVLTVPSSFMSLKWSDPLAGSNNDYDLFVLNSSGTTIKAFSAGAQTGTQSPYEFVFQGSNCGTASASGYCPAAGDRLVVVLYSGSARALHLDTDRGQLSLKTAGATFGHNAGFSTVSMAATYWNSAHTGTRPFTGFANQNEVFSSDGPRKIFFNPDGTAITPGNFLFRTNGGVTLQKPDFAAADGVSAKTPGFTPFFGTSAAAPHAAGIAALILSARPDYTPAQVKAALTATALDSMTLGNDRDSGFGVIMALSAVQYALTH